MPVRWKRGYTWVTLGMFVTAFAGHWAFGWVAYKEEQGEHGSPVRVRGFLVEAMRDTLENWQSEFLQLVWQVAGLSFLYHVGSPQSKEGDERQEEKLDLLLDRAYGSEQAASLRRGLEERYPRK